MTVIIDKIKQFSEQHPQVKLPRAKHMQKGLLIATTACAILSLIPPLRLAGALALRGVALLASGVNVMDDWKREGALGRLMKIAKVAVVILGLVALAAASPVLVIASLVVDLALQIFEFGKAIYERDVIRALSHLAFIVIDTLALAGIIAGSWELMVAAIAVQSAAMLAFAGLSFLFAYLNQDASQFIDTLCFIALAGTGIAGAVRIAEISKPQARFYWKNITEYEMEAKDSNGEVVATLKPGESAEFTLDIKETIFEDYSEGPAVKLYYKDQFFTPHYLEPTELIDVVTQKAMPASLFPTVPVGGPAFAFNFRKLFTEKKSAYPTHMF